MGNIQVLYLFFTVKVNLLKIKKNINTDSDRSDSIFENNQIQSEIQTLGRVLVKTNEDRLNIHKGISRR